jgi:hypothetical protein
VSDQYGRELRHKIESLSALSGEPLLRALRDVVELAKANGDGDTVAEFARHLIQVGAHEGRLDYEMIGFGEMKALYQRDANYADLRGYLLWYYKWVTERLPEYVEVSPRQIESTFADMERFYSAEQEGIRPVLALRARAAAFMGHADDARRYLAEWEAAPEVESDDCPACQTHSRVQLLLDLDQPAEAVEAAGPVIGGGQSCEEVPATTFCRLLLPMLLLGKAEEALFLSVVVRRQVRLVPKMLSYLADQVIFLSCVGVLDTARRLALVMAARAEVAPNPFDQFCASRAGWVFLSRLAKEGGGTEIRLPRTAIGAGGECVPLTAAAGHYETRARQLAGAFDRRHGTDRFARLVAEAEQLATM